jgi:hypothetical protein
MMLTTHSKLPTKKKLLKKQDAPINEPWTQEELTLLTKAVIKFPVGVQNRYNKIKEFIGGNKSINSIISKVKYSTGNMESSSSNNNQLENLYKKYKDNTQQIVPPTTKKESVQSNVNTNEPKKVQTNVTNSSKTNQTNTPTTNTSTNTPKTNTPTTNTPTTNNPKTNTPTTNNPTTNTPTNPTTNNPTTNTPTTNNPTTNNPTTNTPTNNPKTTPQPNVSDWTNEEQSALQEALRKFPSSLGTERWDRIAESIQTRTKKECILRYKFLVSIVKKSKEQT